MAVYLIQVEGISTRYETAGSNRGNLEFLTRRKEEGFCVCGWSKGEMKKNSKLYPHQKSGACPFPYIVDSRFGSLFRRVHEGLCYAP